MQTHLSFTATSDVFTFQFANATVLVTSQVFRDPSAWYHVVLAVDTTQATAANRAKLYINGSQVTAFSTATYMAQNATSDFNNNVLHNIASFNNATEFFDGYLTEINFIDGQALTPTSFGEFDSFTGVWKPKKYLGTYGTNGFYLNFSDNSAATAAAIGKDSSGSGNNWTPNNISVTQGLADDSMIDVPTLWADGGNGRGNYPVLNPLKRYSANFGFSNANLTVSDATATSLQAVATMRTPTSGKWYWEVTNTAGSGLNCFAGSVVTEAIADGSTINIVGAYRSNGAITNLSAVAQTSGATYTTNDVIGVAVDIDNGTVQFYKNGVAQGATPSFTFTAGTILVPSVGADNSAGTKTYSINFGQRSFWYTPPTGFKALNTQNLPDATIKKGNQHFDASIYTGNGSSPNTPVTGLAFAPDLVWIKVRNSGTYFHMLADTLRGGGKSLNSNSTQAEVTNDANGYLSAFNSDGFTVSAGATSQQNVNVATGTYAAWEWNAGGNTVSNTAGSITSSVRANPTAGFSIVTYTGNGTAGATVGHGLNVAPKMIVLKTRAGGVSGWHVYHASANASPATGRILLDTTAAWAADSTAWNNTAPGSSVFTLGTSNAANTNGNTYVAYCFAEVAGFSKIGAWQNNNSTDGTFVYLGFRPKFLLFKSYDATEAWYIQDSSRQLYNYGPGTSNFLLPNLSNAEQGGVTAATAGIDFLSNGFKIRTTNPASGEIGFGTRNYIFMAFAENPFKNALAR